MTGTGATAKRSGLPCTVTPSALPALVRTLNPRDWVVLVTLCAIYVLNFVGRSLLGILAKPIQNTLQVPDTQLGMIG